MNTAEWIIVAILSTFLLVFLIVGIILFIKLIGITSEAKKIVVKGQDIAENANGIVSNVKGLTSIGGVVQTFTEKYIDPKFKKAAEAEAEFEKIKKAKKSESKSKTDE